FRPLRASRRRCRAVAWSNSRRRASTELVCSASALRTAATCGLFVTLAILVTVTRTESLSRVASPASLPDHLDQHPLGPAAVELAVEDLLPGPEVQLAARHRHHDVAPHDWQHVVGMPVVLA